MIQPPSHLMSIFVIWPQYETSSLGLFVIIQLALILSLRRYSDRSPNYDTEQRVFLLSSGALESSTATKASSTDILFTESRFVAHTYSGPV